MATFLQRSEEILRALGETDDFFLLDLVDEEATRVEAMIPRRPGHDREKNRASGLDAPQPADEEDALETVALLGGLCQV